MKRIEDALSVDDLHNLLAYDPATGVLSWRLREATSRALKTFNTRFGGKPAGSICAEGYIRLTLQVGDRVFYPHAHRLIAAMMLGRWLRDDEEVDHENTKRYGNTWLNLRVCEHSDNGKNQTLFSTNTSGFKGVYFNKQRRKWLAQILIHGRRKSIGYFDSAAEGARAYDAEAARHFGEFARTNAQMGLL